MTLSKAALAERDMERCVCTPDEWVGRVEAGDPDQPMAGHASVWVCALAEHRAAAERWARAITKQEPRFVPKAHPKARAERLFDVEPTEQWTGSKELVVTPAAACPACGGPLETETVDQRPLLRHGGYGAALRTQMRHCRCGWRMQSESGEVKP